MNTDRIALPVFFVSVGLLLWCYGQYDLSPFTRVLAATFSAGIATVGTLIVLGIMASIIGPLHKADKEEGAKSMDEEEGTGNSDREQ